MKIKIEASPDARLIMFAAQNVVERIPVRHPDLKAEGSRLWLKNGYGIDLERLDNGTVMLTVIRRGLNVLYRTAAGTPATRPEQNGIIGNVDTEEILRVLMVLHTLPPFMHRDMRLNTMGRIMIHADKTGNHFFDNNNASLTKQSRARTAHSTFGPAGSFFVTGEITRAGERRKYTVRRAWFSLKFNSLSREWEPFLNIENASGFRDFLTPQAALNDASKRAQTERDRYMFLPDPQARSPFASK